MTTKAQGASARVTRSDQISSKREAGSAFLMQRSGQVLITAALAMLGWRLALGSFRSADLVMIVLTIVLLGPVEWLVHRFLLHAPAGSFRMKRLGTGTGHVEHHKDPAELRWLMLCWHDVGAFLAGLGALSAAFAFPVAALSGVGVLPVFVTQWTIAAFALLHYEWTHLLVHTRYRCRSRYYRALEGHHRLHHYRNENYWLGVTARTGDRLFATMPERSAVEASPTAQTLGAT